MKFKIGNVEIKNRVGLAPMAGVSNPTYMKICEDMGVGFAVSELISAEAVVRKNQKTFDMLKGIDKLNIPVAIQIFGSNPEVMAEAAKILLDKYKVDFIDINMGCPVPKVALKNNAGSALMKNPKLAGEIVKKVVDAVDVPVTVKIRSGWDFESINAVSFAKILEKSGVSAITIHGRTRSQGYSGVADWNIIKEVVKEVNIPVIGNGDIKSCYDAKRMLDETKCSAVMIGRALLGNPWLIKECVNYLEDGTIIESVSYHEKIAMMEKHLNDLVLEKGEALAVLEMRGHILNYIKGLPLNKEIKNDICRSISQKEITNILENYKSELKNL